MRKQTIFAASSATAAIVLAVALVGMVNWLGYRHYSRGDWTSSKLYTLSEKTLNVLKGVTKDVRVVVLMTPVHAAVLRDEGAARPLPGGFAQDQG